MLFAAAVVALPLGAARAHRCTGDCDASDTVTITEAVRGVRIALGVESLDECRPFDADRDQRVSVDELSVALRNMMTYCGHGRPPSPACPVPVVGCPN